MLKFFTLFFFYVHIQFLSDEKVKDTIMNLAISTFVYKTLSSLCFKGSLKIERPSSNSSGSFCLNIKI